MDKLKIVNWNIQGLRAKYQELCSILNERQVSVACLQETLLGDATWQPSKKYKIEKSPHIAGEQNRGAAIIIHAPLQYSRLRLDTTMEAVAITVHSERQYTICSLYLSPNLNITKEEIRDLINQLPRPYLLMGDFNAKHPAWDFENPVDARGRMVHSLIVEESLGLLNQGQPTHYHIQTNSLSAIDLCLSSINIMGDFHLGMDEDLHGSDHFPMYLTQIEYLPQYQTPRWITKRANWELFSEITETITEIPECEPLEFYNRVTDKIIEGADKAIPKSDGYYKLSPVPWWNEHCSNLKKERLRAQKKMQRSPTIANRTNYKRIRALFQRAQKDAQASSWKKYVSTVNSTTESSKVWKKVNKIKGKYSPKPPPTLKINGQTISQPKEVAQTLAEHYATASVKTRNLYPREYSQARSKRRRAPFSRRGGHPDNEHLNAPFSLRELNTQLEQCKDTAPGPDGIMTSMVEHLTTPAKSTLLTALNKLWEAEAYPDQWKKETKLPFLKPGKDPSQPSSYRPISLTSCICKLFERMVNHRLVWFLECNNIICPQQAGFRKNMSTIDSLTQLTCHIEKGFQEKKHTIAVFFDLEKAYDTVWRSEILNSMHNMGLRGKLPAFAEGFLSDRRFCVRVGASHSEYLEQEEGLPQGSVLSVALFAIAINSITEQIGPHVLCTLYVDDFTIYISSANLAHSSRSIQVAINNLEKWAKIRGMKFSSEKTVAIKFEKRRKGEEPHLTLQGNPIQVRESTPYLGLIIDKRLNWRDHVDHLRAKCTSPVNLIKHLSHLSWGADRRTLQQLYIALVRSKLDYGAQVYGATQSGTLRRLEPIQNACLRAITGAFRSSPAVSLCAETGILPLEYTRDLLTLKHFFKIHSSPNSLTYQAVMGSPQEEVTPKLEHITSLKTKYHVEDTRVLVNKTPDLPIWMHPATKICPYIEVGKQGLPIEEVRANFLAHLEHHQTVHIFTDGSKTSQHVGFAAVFPNTVASGRLTDKSSIFTAELYAIKAAVEGVLSQTTETGAFTVFSDSRSALIALRSDITRCPLVDEIKGLICKGANENKIINFCWVPAHVNIEGNEKADKAAKEAAQGLFEGLPRGIPHTDMKRPLREAVTLGWHRKWNSLGHEGGKLREIKKDVKEWASSLNRNRRSETVLARLRLGHTNLTHAYLMRGELNPPECDRCRCVLTVKHLLLECRKYEIARNRHYNNPTLSAMLGGDTSSVSKLITFLKEANLLNQI